jgi:hypothetical protein
MFAGIRSAAARRRTLKREERGARFFLHREMRRLACVPAKSWTPKPLASGAPGDLAGR